MLFAAFKITFTITSKFRFAAGIMLNGKITNLATYNKIKIQPGREIKIHNESRVSYSVSHEGNEP